MPVECVVREAVGRMAAGQLDGEVAIYTFTIHCFGQNNPFLERDRKESK